MFFDNMTNDDVRKDPHVLLFGTSESFLSPPCGILKIKRTEIKIVFIMIVL